MSHLRVVPPIVGAFLIGLYWSPPVFGASATTKPVIATDVQCSGCVNQTDIAANSVGSAQVQSDAVGLDEIAPQSVGESELTQAVLDRLEALEQATSANQTIKVRADGVAIGTLIDAGHDFYRSLSVYVTLMPSGYAAFVIASEFEGRYAGELMEPSPESWWFDAPGCTGQAYLSAEEALDGGSASIAYHQGIVLGSPDGNRYVPAGSMPISRPTASHRWLSGYCEDFPYQLWVVPALPNDPSITGVPNERFAPPITLGH